MSQLAGGAVGGTAGGAADGQYSGSLHWLGGEASLSVLGPRSVWLAGCLDGPVREIKGVAWNASGGKESVRWGEEDARVADREADLFASSSLTSGSVNSFNLECP